ncbi:DUF3298/DUF4163 domain-containing protein [bacterium]|nr:MAG: DUF3298/DUF4163 domain-containing protein [bacterium]
MKYRLFTVLLGAATVAAPLSSVAMAQEGMSDDHVKTWKGVATLRTVGTKSSTRTLKAEYPVFSGSRPVAQVAGLILKRDALNGYNKFEKDSRGTAKDLGLVGELRYDYDFVPSLEWNTPRLISATTLYYMFMGGAHGMYGTSGYVFGYPQGATRPRQLRLADFFTDGEAASKRVNNLLMAKLRATKGTEQEATWVLEGDVKWVPVNMRENFIAEKDGLRWYFPPYAMGPYAAGEYEVKLTTSELGPEFRAGLLG